MIYTDGACKGNPGPGGWGAWLRSGGHERELFGGEPLTTNNRMELTAVIESLTALTKPCDVELFTDSQYVRKGITEWIHNWKRARLADRGQEAREERRAVASDWTRLRPGTASSGTGCKGHAGDPGNEKADALANAGAAQYL